ncbi:NifB/NifX family molybdenum-iron cluster-binding protein [Halioxenophilus sp. WMMB6]|uniref:NifB/NifX family molybdenum-iron cluster-binding protein n=1 Tax=Halioxenophilus sp. WMMB6 TaxID=3073815 RepID=UPI00295E730A|nr:NifB/NifX family molybdenum-iron cluster-binding protein [Halioxenophilus sp. WMMB6]
MSGLTEDVAVRLALAARALPEEIETRDLVLGILEAVGEPITSAKLNKIRLGRLKRIDVLANIDESYLKEALNFLKGRNIKREPEPLPEVVDYEDGDMPQSVRVACASNSGDKIDGHFGSCKRFLIYQLSGEEMRLIDIREPEAVDDDEDKNVARAQLIDDCRVLYTISIGGPAAAKVVRAGLHPIKLPQGGCAPEVLLRLKETIAGSPPPWLAKAMGQDPEQRARYREEAGA